MIDYTIQAPYFPKFAVNNTYDIKGVNETVYNSMEFALNMVDGCLDQIKYCRSISMTPSLRKRSVPRRRICVGIMLKIAHTLISPSPLPANYIVPTNPTSISDTKLY